MNRVAYLNCELKHRDLASRVLIAAHLLKRGIPVVVGQVWALVANGRAGRNLPGAYLFTTANKIQAKGMSWVKNTGHTVVASDEETLPQVDPLLFVTNEAVSVCDRLLIDTPAHESALRDAYPNSIHKFVVTGPVRFETLRTIKIEKVLSDPYVLLNSGLGFINSVHGHSDRAVEMLNRGTDAPEGEAKLRLRFEEEAAKLMVTLVRWLARDHRVVVRPHPSERADTWRDAVPEAEVLEDAPPLPWIKGARIVIHCSSTTGLEAVALGVPALNLDPVHEWGKRHIISEINCTVTNLEDAQQALEPFLANGSGPIAEKMKTDLNFSTNGAENTAKVISETLAGADPLSGPFPWAMMERMPVDQKKFTVTKEEIIALMDGMDMRCAVHQLDDSVFLFVPSA